MVRIGNMLTTSLAAVLVLTVSSCSASGPETNTTRSGQTHRWNLATVFPPGNFHVKNLRTFAQEARKATGGKLDISIHASGSLGLKGPETIAAVRDRIVDAAESSLEWQVGEVPLAALGAMPALALGYRETRVLADVLRPYLNEIFASHNQKLLYMVPWQGQGLYSKYQIETKMDLRGLKMRAASAGAIAFFEELGASPIQLPWSEVVPALASGLIVGVSTSSMSGVDGKFAEFMGYYSRFDWGNPISIVVVNLDAWKALSPESRSAVEKLALELEPRFWEISEELDHENLAVLENDGMRVAAPDPQLRRELLAAGERVWRKYLETASQEAQAVVGEFLERVGR